MPELLSVHGRCPRCSQVLSVPAGQLQSVFRCARCQYRLPGAALVDEARTSPPRLAHRSAAPVLGPFDENQDDQHTRVHLPGSGADDDSEVPLPAVLVEHAPSNAPVHAAHSLSRFESSSEEADEQQTRLHVAGSFDPPAAKAARARPATEDATLYGMPAPPSLTRFDRVGEDAEDQATRVHLADALGGVVKDQTLMGVAPAPAIPGQVPALQRFDQVADDAEDQHTRLQMPISYEQNAGERADRPPPLRPPVAPRGISAHSPSVGLDGFGEREPSVFVRLTLQLSRWIDDWLHEQRDVLLTTLAGLCAIVAPIFDALLGSTRHGATVIAANLVLFFIWTLAFAWLGKLRNDDGAWDYHVAFTRLTTRLRLALEDIGSFGSLPKPLRWRVLGEVIGVAGLLGLGLTSFLTLSQLVWAWPAAGMALFLWRACSAILIILSVIALQAASVPLGFSVAPEIEAPAVAHFPAVLDLSLPLSVPVAHGSTPLHQVLDVLSQWQPREWPNQDSYLVALERHLSRRMGWARVERDRWLGPQRSDGIAPLIVNENLLIEVLRGFDPSAAERVTAKMRAHAKIWRGKPAIIVVFDASRAELLDGQGTPPLEALHQSYPMLTVRMPSARLSLA